MIDVYINYHKQFSENKTNTTKRFEIRECTAIDFDTNIATQELYNLFGD